MRENVYAMTAPGSNYPEYISINSTDDPTLFTVTIRSPPATRDGAYICGYARDKGKLGRCTPGDDRCNNYCNMAPEKGPMQDHPNACEHITEGATAQMTLSASDLSALASAAQRVAVGAAS